MGVGIPEFSEVAVGLQQQLSPVYRLPPLLPSAVWGRQAFRSYQGGVMIGL